MKTEVNKLNQELENRLKKTDLDARLLLMSVAILVVFLAAANYLPAYREIFRFGAMGLAIPSLVSGATAWWNMERASDINTIIKELT